MKKEENSYLIMYVIMDFLRFVQDLKAQAKDGSHNEQQVMEELQVYANLYLKHTIGEEQTELFLKEFTSMS